MGFASSLRYCTDVTQPNFALVPESCVILYWQSCCMALEQWASAKLCSVVSSRDMVAIAFDIGRLNCLVASVFTRENAEYFPLNTLSREQQQRQLFYGPFSGATEVSRCQKRTSGLYGAWED